MKFERICIIGTGLIGGSLALAFRRNNIGSFVTGVDRAETAAGAVEAGIFDRGLPIEQLPLAVIDADLIILATPIQHILAVLPQVAAHARQACLVTDVGSTKGEITRLAEKVLPPGPGGALRMTQSPTPGKASSFSSCSRRPASCARPFPWLDQTS